MSHSSAEDIEELKAVDRCCDFPVAVWKWAGAVRGGHADTSLEITYSAEHGWLTMTQQNVPWIGWSNLPLPRFYLLFLLQRSRNLMFTVQSFFLALFLLEGVLVAEVLFCL